MEEAQFLGTVSSRLLEDLTYSTGLFKLQDLIAQGFLDTLYMQYENMWRYY